MHGNVWEWCAGPVREESTSVGDGPRVRRRALTGCSGAAAGSSRQRGCRAASRDGSAGPATGASTWAFAWPAVRPVWTSNGERQRSPRRRPSRVTPFRSAPLRSPGSNRSGRRSGDGGRAAGGPGVKPLIGRNSQLCKRGRLPGVTRAAPAPGGLPCTLSGPVAVTGGGRSRPVSISPATKLRAKRKPRCCSGARLAPVAVRRAAVPGVVDPATAPVHPVRARAGPAGSVTRPDGYFVVPVRTPFPHVAVHVVQAEAFAWYEPTAVGPLQVRTFARAAVW